MSRIQAEAQGRNRLRGHYIPGRRAIIARAQAEMPLEAPPFPIHIRALEGAFRAQDRAHVRGKLARRLRKFAESIERVSLRCEDVNGPRGGVDRVCRVKVVLRGLPSVVFEQRDVSLNAAVDLALDGVERAVRRALQRRRMKPLKHRN
jgi:ribosome-associated translation inhibitor RaiA